MKRWPGLREEKLPSKTVVCLILLIHCTLLVHHARVHSPGWDEVGHFGSGMVHLQTGVFDLYRVNPPLVRTWACLLPYAAGATSELSDGDVYSGPTQRGEFWVGQKLMDRYGPSYMGYLELARYLCIPFSLLGALSIYDLSKLVFGPRSAVAGLTLWCFSPLVLGHGSMITPDMPAAATACFTVCMLVRWQSTKAWLAASITGVALGIAILTKLTNLILIPIVCLVCIYPFLRKRERAQLPKATLQLLLSGLMAIYVINLGYGFERSFTRLGEFRFVSRLFAGEIEKGESTGNRFAGTMLASVPVPVPANMLQGIDVQRRDFQNGMISFLGGRWEDRGWWYYYIYGFFVKEPVGTIVLVCFGGLFIRRFFVSTSENAMLYIVFPAVMIIAFVSSQTGFNHHLRYTLPAYPFLYVLASSVVAINDSRVRRIGVICITSSVISCLMVCPHSMSYFNAMAGGPRGGHKHLHNSNLDWGQDVLFLHEWLKDHPEARPIQVDFSGGFDPNALRIWDDQTEFHQIDSKDVKQLLNGKSPKPYYAVSIGHLCDPTSPLDRFATFRGKELYGRAGYSILIYRQ